MTSPSQYLRRNEPKAIVFTITDGAIEYDNGNSHGFDRKKVWARTRGAVVFLIQNNDDNACEVTIPFGEFEPKAGAPAAPIDEVASGMDTVAVPAGDIGLLRYAVKPTAHFHFPLGTPCFTYKYTLHYRNTQSGVTVDVDPDLEISPGT